MNRKILAAVLAFVLAAGVSGCGAKGAKSDEKSNTDSGEKVVRILTPGVDADGNAALQESLFIAREEGFLDEELKAAGYTAQYTGFASAGVGVNEALAAGEGDVAVYGDFPAITYISNNGDASIFAVASSRQQLGILAADGLDDVKSLKGKRIGTIFGTIAYKYLLDELEANNLSKDDVELVNATTDLASLYLSGDIDAVAQGNEYLYYIQALGGKGDVIAISGNDAKLASNYVVLGKNDYLEKNPEVKTAFQNALKKAQQFAEENPEKVYEAFAKQSGGVMSEDIYKKTYSFDKTFSFWNPEVTDEVKERLQTTADFMYSNGYLGSKVDIEKTVK